MPTSPASRGGEYQFSASLDEMFLGEQTRDVLGPTQLGGAPAFGTQATQEEQAVFEEATTMGLEAEDTSGAAAVASRLGAGLASPPPIRTLHDTTSHHQIPSRTLPSR
jgi:hypothetical protein